MQILQSGRGDIYSKDPDAVRAQRAHKARGLINKLMTEKEAVSRFGVDGDYLGCDLTYFIRGPNVLLHEIIGNSSYVGGTYDRPGRRFAGAVGANGIASLCWRTLFVMMQEKRRFVPQLDFITSPGFLDGSPQARENAGLPAHTGPYRVVTPMALFDFDAHTHRMRLITTAPTVKAEQVLAEMAFEPLMARTVEEMAPPTADELAWLRERIDPDRVVIGKGKTIRS
jgi:hypothetical protein